jgi:glycosyltransferase involved in cell wall biosynthesis
VLPPSYAWPDPPTDANIFDSLTYARDRHFQRRLPMKLVWQATAFTPAYPKPGIEPFYRDVTVVIKAFERPACLENLVLGLYRRYPSLAIVILDDSSLPFNGYFVHDYPQLRYVRAPHNVGLSRGRNLLVDAVQTPYLVLMDDDFGLAGDLEPLLLELMYEVRLRATIEPVTDLTAVICAQTIVRSGADIVGGDVLHQFGSFKLWKAPDARAPELQRMHLWTAVPPTARYPSTPAIERRLKRERLLDVHTGAAIPECWEVDMVNNFFIARTAALRRVRWDDRLVVGEHEDFFLRAKDARLRIAYCRGYGYHVLNLGTDRCLTMRAVDALGQPDPEALRLAQVQRVLYSRGRSRQFVDYWPIMFAQHNIVRSRLFRELDFCVLMCEGGRVLRAHLAATTTCSVAPWRIVTWCGSHIQRSSPVKSIFTRIRSKACGLEYLGHDFACVMCLNV